MMARPLLKPAPMGSAGFGYLEQDETKAERPEVLPIRAVCRYGGRRPGITGRSEAEFGRFT